MIRLYGPVLTAVLLGLHSYALVPRYNDPVLGPWLNRRPNTYPGDAVAVDATLVTGSSGRISALWSLQWEVLYSLLRPLFVLVVRYGRRFDLLKAAGLLALVAVGSFRDDAALLYLPMFAVGALTAARWRSLRTVEGTCAAGWRPFWVVVAVTGVLLTGARWELIALGALRRHRGRLRLPGRPRCLAAGADRFCNGARSVLEAPLLQWSRRISAQRVGRAVQSRERVRQPA